jgi:hypothetical protein
MLRFVRSIVLNPECLSRSHECAARCCVKMIVQRESLAIHGKTYAVAFPRTVQSRLTRCVTYGSAAPTNHVVSRAWLRRACDTTKEVLPPCRRQSESYRQLRHQTPRKSFQCSY